MKPHISRRTFLRGTAGTALVAGLPGCALLPDKPGNAMGNEAIRIALIGCGGRGTGAANQALSTPGRTKLVAMADAFSDRLESSLNTLSQRHGENVAVPAEKRFTGFGSFQKATAEADLVILATPPGFRPQHFEHAIQQGKHVFMEKPVAVDGPGIRRVLAAAQEAKLQSLKVGVGLQRHHQNKYLQGMEQVRNGAIGEVQYLRCYWNSAGVWVRGRKPGQSELEYQMRNWYYFNWICGDHIVEQHIHNLDVCNWVMGGPPAQAHGAGGRHVRTGLDHGEIFDHHAVEYTYENGTKMFSQCRHMPGTRNSVTEHAHGTLGWADLSSGKIRAKDGSFIWRFQGKDNDPYQQEHDDLFAAVRSGRAYNEAEVGAASTMTAILGRMATYSGKNVSFKQGIQSELTLAPDMQSWKDEPPILPDADGRYPIPMPGKTVAF